jgi:hypothetical protein
MVQAMSPVEVIQLFIVLATAKVVFLLLLIFLPVQPGVPAVVPRPVPSITIQVRASSDVRALRAAPLSRTIRTAQAQDEARGAVGPPFPILQVAAPVPTFLIRIIRAPSSLGPAPRAPPA